MSQVFPWHVCHLHSTHSLQWQFLQLLLFLLFPQSAHCQCCWQTEKHQSAKRKNKNWFLCSRELLKMPLIWHTELSEVVVLMTMTDNNSSIDFRTPTESRAPSITSWGGTGWWIKYLPAESKNILHQYRFLNVCKTCQTGIGVISRQSGKKTVISLVQGGDEQGIPSCHCCTPCSILHSLWSKCAPAESWTWLPVANRYLITELNSASCTAGMFAEKVAARSSSKSRSYI